MANLVVNRIKAAPEVLRHVTVDGYIDLSVVDPDLKGSTGNASNAESTAETGAQAFLTAWQTPIKALTALSAAFPEQPIELRYADEDLGRNCGTVVLLGGVVLRRDINPVGAGSPDIRVTMAFWRNFAKRTWGGNPGTFYRRKRRA